MGSSSKICRKLHRWLGIISGPIVFILGLTGCILAFDEELEAHFNRLRVEAMGQTEKPIGELNKVVQGLLKKGQDISVIEIPNTPNLPWRFRTFREGNNDGIWYWDEKEYYESLFVDPYAAQVIAKENSEFNFFRIVLYLHWSLLFKTSIGQPIVGIATLMYFVSLLTGLYLWWPSNKKSVNKRLSFKWKSSTGIKRKIYDLHNVLGFYILSIGVLLALTGMVWAFPSFGAWVQKGLDGGVVKQSSNKIRPTHVAADIDPYAKILQFMRENYPLASAYVFYNTTITPDQKISVLVKFKKTFSDVIIVADVRSGEVYSTITFDDKTIGQKFRELNYGIHVGSALGIWGKVLVFVASLISASLPLTGFLIWINRGKGKLRKQNKPMRGRRLSH